MVLLRDTTYFKTGYGKKFSEVIMKKEEFSYYKVVWEKDIVTYERIDNVHRPENVAGIILREQETERSHINCCSEKKLKSFNLISKQEFYSSHK